MKDEVVSVAAYKDKYDNSFIVIVTKGGLIYDINLRDDYNLCEPTGSINIESPNENNQNP